MKTPFDFLPEISFEDLSEDKKEELFDLAHTILNDLLVCNRDWNAWQVGSMSSDDFYDADDDESIVQETAETIFKFINTKQ